VFTARYVLNVYNSDLSRCLKDSKADGKYNKHRLLKGYDSRSLGVKLTPSVLPFPSNLAMLSL
jgi:hypothetical protein